MKKTITFFAYLILGLCSTNYAQNLEVSGTITPGEAIGVYIAGAQHNSKTLYTHTSGLYFIYWDGTTSWNIDDNLSSDKAFFYMTNSPNDPTTSSGAVWNVDQDATGTPTVEDTALPVELTSFTANLIENKIVLNWQTATEVNNYGFEIEKQNLNQVQNDTDLWETIGFVEGHGNSNSPKEYSFVDADKLSGTVKYRLKQIDIDGGFEYSDIIDVEISSAEQFKLSQNYPNPFNPTTMVSYTLPNDSKVKIEITNMLGQSVGVLVNDNKSAGYYEATWNASNLPSGIYFINIIANGVNSTESFTQVEKALLLK